MNSLKSLLASMATLLLISGSLARVHNHPRFMHNGKVYDDKFYELFSNKAPVKHIIKLAVSWNAAKQLEHFEQLNHHIKTNDESAKYAQSIVDATRAVLAATLKEVGFEKEITLEQYLRGTYLIQADRKSEVESDVLEAIDLLDKIDDDTFEQILNEGAQEEVDWELQNLRPYDMVPFDDSESVPKPETEVKPIVESQELKESTPEPKEQESSLQKSEETVPEREELIKVDAEPSKPEDVLEMQESKEPAPQLEASEETVSTLQES